MLIFEIAFLVVAALMLVVDIIFLLSTFFQDHGKVKSGEERNGNIGRNRRNKGNKLAPQCRKVGTC